MATIRDRKEKLATVEENNNFSDSPRAPPPPSLLYVYIARLFRSRTKFRDELFTRNIPATKTPVKYIFFSFLCQKREIKKPDHELERVKKFEIFENSGLYRVWP